MFIVDKLVEIFKFNIILFILWYAMDNFFFFGVGGRGRGVNFIISAKITSFSLDDEG